MEAFVAPCSRLYTAAHSTGTRPTKDLWWVVLHSTEGATAESAASWFQNPAAEGSATLCVDDNICYRTLGNEQVPWAAAGGGNTPGGWANYHGIHIEQAGFAHWTRTEWLSHDALLRRAAYKTALHCKQYGIPLRWVGPVGLRLGRKGVTTHRDVSYAWPLVARKYGFHTDPGSAYPKDRFMVYAQKYLAELGNL